MSFCDVSRLQAVLSCHLTSRQTILAASEQLFALPVHIKEFGGKQNLINNQNDSCNWNITIRRMSLAASVLTRIVSAFQSVAQSNEVPLKTIVAALLLYGVKEFLNDIIFSCPDENFGIYGSLFIFGPTIFLFCLSLLASSSFWQVVTGCLLLKWREKKLLLLKTKNSVFVAFLPPVIWLTYAFVEEDYYICAKLGPLNRALAKANTSAEKDAVNKQFSQAKTLSQLIAWGLLLGLVIISTIFVTIYRLCMPIDPKLLGKYAYQEYEADKAVMIFNERIQPLAEQDAIQLVDDLFDRYKDKKSHEQINLIEKELKNIFPRHAGDLNAPFRVQKGETQPRDTSLTVPAPVPVAVTQPGGKKYPPTGDVELQPIVA